MKELLLEFQGNVQFFMIFFWLIFLGASITYLLDYIEDLFGFDTKNSAICYGSDFVRCNNYNKYFYFHKR